MRQLFVGVALLTACGFQHGITLDDAAPMQRDAPIDSRAIDAPPVMIDAPPDSSNPSDDTDGDGILDAVDNCPTMANADQRDHDGDLHGDVCDHCPHLASTLDPDGDGDGVGDACDPRPTTAGDSRALWEGFYDANSIQNWVETGNGSWSVANGVLTQSSSSASTTTNTLGPTLSVPRAAVTAGVHVIALGNPGQNGFATPHTSVVAGVSGSNQSYWCSVVDEGQNGKKVYATTVTGGNANFPNTNWSGTFAANSDLRLTSALLGTNNPCTVVQGTTTATTQGNTGGVAGTVQVATRTASASFDYLFVVSIGP